MSDFFTPAQAKASEPVYPYENAYDRALKELSVLRESLVGLRTQIKPVLLEELPPSEAKGFDSDPTPSQSPVVRDFDNLRYEIANVATIVQSIRDRVYV